MVGCDISGCQEPAQHVLVKEDGSRQKLCTRCGVFHYRRDVDSIRLEKLDDHLAEA
jgi:hypothetical protein